MALYDFFWSWHKGSGFIASLGTCLLLDGLLLDEHSEKARAPHTNGSRNVPRCGALSLLQKSLLYRENSAEIAPTLNVKLWDSVVVVAVVVVVKDDRKFGRTEFRK